LKIGGEASESSMIFKIMGERMDETIRKITKPQYYEIRRRVRKNILLNSEQALRQRVPLSGQDVLMGGIVVRKELKLAKISCNGQAMIKEYGYPMREREIFGDSNGAIKTECDFIAYAEMTLYDFSGFCEVSLEWKDWDAKLLPAVLRIKTGEEAYVNGQIIAMNNSAGYYLKGDGLFGRNELELYKQVGDRYESRRKEILELKSRAYFEKDEDVLFLAREPMDIIRLFLKNSPAVDSAMYHMLTGAIYEMYLKSHSVDLPKLILKYFLLWVGSQNWSEGDAEWRGTDWREPLAEEDVAKEFFEYYPDLIAMVDLSSRG